MDIRNFVRISGQFVQALGTYNVYVIPPKDESEKKSRYAKRRRRVKTLKNLQMQLKETLH